METEKYQIEKGLPVPPKHKRCGIASTTFRQLEVGDSFVCKMSERMTVYTCAKREGKEITSQKISETEVRIWRIK